MNGPQLDLYFFEACPFCQIVLNTIEKLNLDVRFCDITEDQAHLQKLLADTGRRTVPCLYIDGQPMHESSDIIRWLESNQAMLKKK